MKKPNLLEEQGFLNLKNASLFLDMPVGTLRKRCARAQIKFIRDPYSGRIYFSKRELIRYMKRGEQKTLGEILSMAASQRRLSNAREKDGNRSSWS